MTKIINPHSKPMIEFNREKRDKINSLCSPLEQHFGISAFGYLRAFDDGQYILISNNESYLEAVAVNDCCFRSEYFIQQAELFCKYEPCVDIWPDEVRDEAIDLYRARGYFNGFSIAQYVDGSIEGCWFSNNDENSGIKEFYRKHSAVLSDFITRFRALGGNLTDPSGPARLGVSPYLQEAYPQIDKIFKATTPWERKITDFNIALGSLANDGIDEIRLSKSLTQRELDCLMHFSLGKTSKEISRSLNISPRTVEIHLGNLRLKTHCQSRVELMGWFKEAFRVHL